MDENDEKVKEWVDDYSARILEAAQTMDIAGAKIQEWQWKLEEGSIRESDCRDRQRPWAARYKAARTDFERLKALATNLREMADNLGQMKDKGILEVL